MLFRSNDFKDIKYFLENTSIDTIYCADYLERIDAKDILQHLGEGWKLITEANQTPSHFNQKSWTDFWSKNQEALKFSTPERAYAFQLTAQHREGKVCQIVYLGTEAIQTYHILINSCQIKPDLIILQDHGFGGNWGGQTFGYSEDQKAKLYGISKVSASLPDYLLVGENTVPWPEYNPITDFEGSHGNAGHRRALFRLNKT